MEEMAVKHILPAIGRYTGKLAETAAGKKAVAGDVACAFETGTIRKLSDLADSIYEASERLTELREKISTGEWDKESEDIRDSLIPAMEELRRKCDAAEVITAKDYWPFPTYGDLMFDVIRA